MKPSKTNMSITGPCYIWEVRAAEFYDSGRSRYYLTALLASYVVYWRVLSQRFILRCIFGMALGLQKKWPVLANHEKIVRW